MIEVASVFFLGMVCGVLLTAVIVMVMVAGEP